MYKPIVIAHYFLSKFGKDGSITPMKLTKLVYIAHGWYLALAKQPLLDENAEAWKYGPVIPSLYQEFKSFGNSPITRDYNFGISLPDSTSKFLDEIYRIYGKFDGIQLSTLTHQQDSPWYKAWYSDNGKNKQSFQISDSSIQDHYLKLLEDRKRKKAVDQNQPYSG